MTERSDIDCLTDLTLEFLLLDKGWFFTARLTYTESVPGDSPDQVRFGANS